MRAVGMRSWCEGLLLLAIILFGSYLRFSGIQDDFPFIYTIDEKHVIERAIGLLSRGSLDPEWYGHPAQFTMYSLAMSYKALFYLTEFTGNHGASSPSYDGSSMTPHTSI